MVNMALQRPCVNRYMGRPLCSVCNKHVCAVNYYKNGKPHFRSKCGLCHHQGKRKKPYVPRWKQKGYQKKNVCDLCGFKSKYSSQIVVFHMNGNLNDASITNLRSVCLNCVVEIEKNDLLWKQGDLIRDF